MVFITNYLVDICKSRYGHPLNILFIKETQISCCVRWYLCFGRDESPWLSCISPRLRSGGTDCFSSRLTFKSICMSYSIGSQSHVPSLRAKNWHTMLYSVIRTVCPSRARGQESLLPIMKYSSSLNSGFFSYNAIRHVCRFHRALFFSLWVLGLMEQEDADTPVSALAMSNKVLSLGPSVLCLLPRSWTVAR